MVQCVPYILVYMNRFLVTACLTFFIAMHLLYIDFFIGKKTARPSQQTHDHPTVKNYIKRKKKIECWRLFWSLLFSTALQPLPCRSVLPTSHELNPVLQGVGHENLTNFTKLEVLSLNKNLYWFLNFSDETVIFHMVKMKTSEVGNRQFFVSPIVDSPIYCGLDPISDSFSNSPEKTTVRQPQYDSPMAYICLIVQYVKMPAAITQGRQYRQGSQQKQRPKQQQRRQEQQRCQKQY